MTRQIKEYSLQHQNAADDCRCIKASSVEEGIVVGVDGRDDGVLEVWRSGQRFVWGEFLAVR